MNSDWVCDDCKETAYLEGNSKIYQTVTELETRVEWLEKGLKQIKAQTLCLDDMIQSILDGEPTTADEENEILLANSRAAGEGDWQSDDGRWVWYPKTADNVVYISDVNKEIAKEWKKEDVKIDFKDRDREKKIKGSRDYWEPKKKVPKTGKKANIIQSIGYRGED
jgi:hypothetical protein